MQEETQVTYVTYSGLMTALKQFLENLFEKLPISIDKINGLD